jgi:hypothetical protein
MVKALPARGLVLAGAMLLLATGGVVLAGAVRAATTAPGPELGPPIVVQDVAVTPSVPITGPDTRHDEDGDGDDDDRLTVVDPAPAQETDSDDEHGTARPHG